MCESDKKLFLMFAHICVFWFWNSLTNTRSHAHANTVLKHTFIRTQKHSRVKHAGRDVCDSSVGIFILHTHKIHTLLKYTRFSTLLQLHQSNTWVLDHVTAALCDDWLNQWPLPLSKDFNTN